MNFVILFGPPAVGKMTVGQEMSKITGYPLLHKHMTIDLVTELFDYGTPQYRRLVSAFRQMLVAEAAASDLPGLIFTYAWYFEKEGSQNFVDGLSCVVADHGSATFYAKIEAGQDIRPMRNRTENRLRRKKKANFARDEASLLQMEGQYRVNSSDVFPFSYPENHIRIDNSNLSASVAARHLAAAFRFPITEREESQG